MYFEIEDHRPDITPVGSVISGRERVLISIIVHLLLVIAVITSPRWMPERVVPVPAQQAELAEKRDPPRFVFVQPRVDTPAPKPPPQAPPSDLDRQARSRERVELPKNPEPLSRGNTRERVEQAEQQAARGTGPTPDPSLEAANAAPPSSPEREKLPEATSALQLPDTPPPPPQAQNTPSRPLGGGRLGDALRNLQRYVQKDQFDNNQGGGAFGPAIQFDTKGVEFGPWIRRFIAQVKRNWEPLIPLSAMSTHGRVVVTFNVHKDGRITDLQVIGPSPVSAFNTAAYGALASSNPTATLPPEYPSESAFFTVTFFYNEEPQ